MNRYHFYNTIAYVQPDNIYIVRTDQGDFKIRAARINYKETIKQYYKKGYTGVKISYIGRAL